MTRENPPTKSLSVTIQLILTAAIGLQFGILEALWLHRRGFAITLGALLELTVIHAAIGIALGIPFLVLILIPDSVVPRTLRSSTRILPALFVLFSMAAITVNVRELRRVLHPVSLAWDLGILLAVILIGWIWTRRYHGRWLVAVLVSAIVLADVAVIAVAMWPKPQGHGTIAEGPVGPVMENAPNVLFFLIDTLRADHLGVYGYSKPVSPRIDQFAMQGAVFDRAYAAGSWTRSSMASLHTSTMPSRHGVVAVDTALPTSLPLLSEQFTKMGYLVSFFTNGVNISPDIGYGRGVEHFDVPQTVAAVERTPIFKSFVLRYFPAVRSWVREKSGSTSPGERNQAVLEWARNVEPSRPVFLYVHYMGPHTPYMPPLEFLKVFSDTPSQRRLADGPAKDAGRDALNSEDLAQTIAQYDGEILMHDYHLGGLLDELGQLGWLDNAIVVITADHGEGFGEHGVWRHGHGLFQEIVRVPLIIWSSASWNEPRRFDVPVSLVDLGPTLVDLVGGKSPEAWDGNSIRPWLAGERDDKERVVFQEDYPWGKGLRNAEWSYLESTRDETLTQWLYSSADPKEEENLVERYPGLVQEFQDLVRDRAEIDASRHTEGSKMELDEATKERLRALGYLD